MVLRLLAESEKLVGLVPPSFREDTVSGTLSPPVFCTQNVTVSVRSVSVLPKSTDNGLTLMPGWPISAGQMLVTRTSSNRPPPSH